MRAKHTLLGALGVLTFLLLTAFSGGAAQAGHPVTPEAPGERLTAPAAPDAAAPRSAAQTSPGVSPSADYIRVAPGGGFTCPRGNLCTAAWDPTTAEWKIFFLYRCDRYHLSHWQGTGHYWNKQTGDPTSYFYDRNGAVITSFRPFDGRREADWDPVWSIRNC